MDCHLHRALIHSQLGGQFCIGLRAAITQEAGLEGSKGLDLLAGAKLLFELADHLLEQGQRPAVFEGLLRCTGVRRLNAISRLGGFKLDWDVGLAAPSLQSVDFVPFIGQESLHCGQQERPESPFGLVSAGEPLVFEHPRKEFLCQILRVLDRVAAPADVSVEGIPVGTTKFLQRELRPWCITAASSQHD
jgi:hypothetical protein